MNVRHEFADPAPAPLSEAPTDQNPYASPLAMGPLLADGEPEPIGIWRNGDQIIMHRDAALPARCIRTNSFCDESERYVFKVNPESVNRSARVATLIGGAILAFYCYSFVSGVTAHYFAGLVMLLAILISFLFTLRLGQEAIILYYHSHVERRRRRTWLVIGSSLLILALFLGLLTFFDASIGDVLSGITPLIALIGAVIFAFAKLQFRAEPLGERYLVIHGCGRAFRGSFPECRLRPFSRRPG